MTALAARLNYTLDIPVKRGLPAIGKGQAGDRPCEDNNSGSRDSHVHRILPPSVNLLKHKNCLTEL